jgi:hypothetical protein
MPISQLFFGEDEIGRQCREIRTWHEIVGKFVDVVVMGIIPVTVIRRSRVQIPSGPFFFSQIQQKVRPSRPPRMLRIVRGLPWIGIRVYKKARYLRLGLSGNDNIGKNDRPGKKDPSV